MNFKVDIINARSLPIAMPEGMTNAFVSVYQVGLKKTKVGVTNAFPNNCNPIWNHSIQIHGIRGMALMFELYHFRQNGQHLLIGTAVMNQENMVLGAQQFIPITPVQTSAQPMPGQNPMLTACVSMISGAQPVPSPLKDRPIPPGEIAYFNLAFGPPYTPQFPIKPTMGCDSCPLDLTFLAFDGAGVVRGIAFNADTNTTHGIKHSGKILTRAYDTFGPSVRLSVSKIFTGQYAAQRALLIVNCTKERDMLSNYGWIAVDVYTCGEKRNAADLMPCFHSRFVVQPCPGTIATAIVIEPSPAGLIMRPIQWFAPNQFVQFPPLFACEVTPELAKLCGFNGSMVNRRTACLPYKPASLTRAITICGFPPNSSLTAGAGWDGNVDLDIACLAFNSAFNLRCICFYNNPTDLNGALTHFGDNRTGNRTMADDETIGFQLALMPPDVHYLAFTLTSVKGIQLSKVTGIKLSLYVNGRSEIYRLNANYCPNVFGLLFLVIYRSSPTEWSMYPMISYSLEGLTPVKIAPFVTSELTRTFH
jgi:stress response protein SCP2